MGLIYRENYVTSSQRTALLDEVRQYYPIWEYRFSENNPPPAGVSQRRLLRPVYWLGN